MVYIIKKTPGSSPHILRPREVSEHKEGRDRGPMDTNKRPRVSVCEEGVEEGREEGQQEEGLVEGTGRWGSLTETHCRECSDSEDFGHLNVGFECYLEPLPAKLTAGGVQPQWKQL